MKTTLFKKIFITSLISLFFITQISTGEDVVISDSSIKIDKLTIGIVQKADIKTFKIDQLFYINNTGNDSFNGSFYIWIPDNSNIIAYCCNDTPNMSCRNDEREEMWCFYFNETDDDNIYVGHPISSENKLSYFGQKESFTITAFSTTNTQLTNDTLQLNATIGGSYISREEESFQGEGIHITSLNQEIEMTPGSYLYKSDPYEYFNITSFDRIRVFNNGSDNETIELNISDLPEGWKAEIWDESLSNKINSISLLPQELANLTLAITAPSYLAQIHVEFTTQTGIDENETQWTFINKYLYETEVAYYETLSTTDEGFNISKDLHSSHDEPLWYEMYGRYWYLASAEKIQPNNESNISFSLKAKMPSSDKSTSESYLIGLLFLIFIAIIVVIILKKKNYFKEKDISQKKTPPKKRKEDLLKEKKSLQKMIKRTESDLSSGLIDKKTAEKMKNEYQAQIDDLDKKLKDRFQNQNINKLKTKSTPDYKKENIKKLEEQKKEVLTAIKKVEKEFEDGVISKNDYEHFRAAYKKRAIEILKEIDKMKGLL